MKLAARLFAAFLCALLPALAWAQTPIVAGPWQPGHAPMFTGAGSFQPVIQDSGPAAGGISGLGLGELMLQARGTGTPPFIGQGTGPLGTNLCDYDAPTNNATGYHYLCFSPNVAGGGLITYGAGGTATAQPLLFNINGQIFNIANAVGLPTIPTNNLIGNISGVPAIPGALTPTQVATLLGAPSIPVVQPSSGNFVGLGGTSAGVPFNANACLHQIPWTDQNVNFCNDVVYTTSQDPSAAAVITLGGSVTAGDTINLSFMFNANTVTVSYAAVAGNTLANVRDGLIAAVKANPALFNAASGTNIYGGGYANNAQIGFIVVAGTNIFAFDYKSTVAMTMKYTVSGAATETITFPVGFFGNTPVAGGSTVNTSYQLPDSFDNNPVPIYARYVLGKAPSAASVTLAIVSVGSNSASTPLGTPNANYGTIASYVCDSTSGHLQSQWIIQADGSGAFVNGGGGLWVGQGVFSNFGNSPCTSGGVQDMGPGTFNTGTCYWIIGINAVCGNGGVLQLLASTNNPIVLNSTGGVQPNLDNATAMGLPLKRWSNVNSFTAQYAGQLFSALPACGVSANGRVAYVGDSTTQTWGATITGGGALAALALCDGGNWTVVGK